MATIATTTSCHQLCRTSACPPWLQAALADIEQRVQALAVSLPEEEEAHSFAERAENYYQKRPQLLALLRDLHNRYVYLADRYSQSLLKPLHRRQISSVHSDFDYDDDPRASDPDSASSDAESSLSFQPLPPPPPAPAVPQDLPSTEGVFDVIVVELVVAAVERDLLAAEAAEVERRWSESARKIELQGSLLEVLESERMVLLGENARLEFRAAAVAEEGRAAAAELGYMRRKAADLARLVVKLREDHRVCLLGRKIEALQAQIFGLERRSRECFEVMARREKEKGEVRFELNRLREENRRLREEAEAVRAKRRARKKDGGGFGKWWWDRVCKIEWAPCAPHVKGGKGCFYL